MTEEAVLVLITLAVVISIGVLAFKLGRQLIASSPNRWIVKLPVYFAFYHICWAACSVVLIPALGKTIFIFNPIYALALKNTGAFEKLFAAILPKFGSQLANIIVLIIGIVVVTTSMWIIAGIVLGGLFDLRRKRSDA